MTQLLNTFPGLPRQQQRVELSGEEWRLVFTWRERTEGWYVDIYDGEDNAVVLGKRIRRFADAAASTLDLPGLLTGIGDETADFNAFGDQFRVAYFA